MPLSSFSGSSNRKGERRFLPRLKRVGIRTARLMNTSSAHFLPDDTRPGPPASAAEQARVAALIQRYSRKPLPPLTFEFTHDTAYLHQYYRLREDEFNSVLRL